MIRGKFGFGGIEIGLVSFIFRVDLFFFRVCVRFCGGRVERFFYK